MVRVQILVAFEVEPADETDNVDDFDPGVAKTAARAASDYLSFVKVSGYSGDSAAVEVDVDGFGACTVRLADPNEDD